MATLDSTATSSTSPVPRQGRFAPGIRRERSRTEVREALAGLHSGALLGRLKGTHQAQVRHGFFALLYGGAPTTTTTQVRTPGPEASEYRVILVDADAVLPNPFRPSIAPDMDELTNLAKSIREQGLVEPIQVVPAYAGEGNKDQYWVISGERRRQAAKQARLQQLPVIIRDVSPRAGLQMFLSQARHTHLQSVLERARGYATLTSKMGMTVEELAVRVGVPAEEVRLDIALLGLEEPILESLEEGRLKREQAEVLLQAPDPEARLALWQHAVRYRSGPERLAERLESMLRDSALDRASSPPAIGGAFQPRP